MAYTCKESHHLCWQDGADDDELVRLNQYSVQRCIGKGSFGEVSYCIDEDSDTPYALKVLSKSKLKKAKFAVYNDALEVVYVTGLSKLRNEIELLKNLRHENIIQLHEVIDDEEDNSIVLVMNLVEYGPILSVTPSSNNSNNSNTDSTSYHFQCNPSSQELFTTSDDIDSCNVNDKVANKHSEHSVHKYNHIEYKHDHSSSTLTSMLDHMSLNGSLTSPLAALQYLPVEYIVTYLNDIVQGLAYLHNNHIAHRDIKPSNLLLSSKNTVIISDFGCAECFSPDSNPRGLVSNTAGTPSFWAPECIQPEKFAADIDLGLCMDSDTDVASERSDTTVRKRNAREDSEVPDSRYHQHRDSAEFESEENTVYQYSAYGLDIWALGVTLYALCYCSLPFHAEDSTAAAEMLSSSAELHLFEMICSHNPMVNIDSVVRESKGYGGIPDELLSIIEGCLEKHPVHRYSVDTLTENEWLSERSGRAKRRGNKAFTPTVPSTTDNNRENCNKNSIPNIESRVKTMSFDTFTLGNVEISSAKSPVSHQNSYSYTPESELYKHISPGLDNISNNNHMYGTTRPISRNASRNALFGHSNTNSNTNNNNHSGGKSVIFLDVDGVLTMSRCLTGDYDDDDPMLLFPEDLPSTLKNTSSNSNKSYNNGSAHFLTCCSSSGDDVIDSSGEYVQFEGVPLERAQLSHLKWLVDKSHAHIVLSSTWRQEPEMRAYLVAALNSVGIPSDIILEDTPCIPLLGRGGEIRTWLDAHLEYSSSYVVLDDNHKESIEKYLEPGRFVETILQSERGNYKEEGLTRELAMKALQILWKQ